MLTSSPEPAGFSTHRLERLTRHLQRCVETGQAAGIAARLDRRRAVAYAQYTGWGDLAAHRPLAPDALFRIYSMTKPITSLALLMLFEQGRVRLSDAVSRYLPEFARLKVFLPGGGLVEPSRPMTIHDLLTHTAGLSYGNADELPGPAGFPEVDAYQTDLTTEALVRQLAETALRFHPGERWHYSLATDVLGRVIEVIAECSLGEFFEQEIFRPLGMTDTGFTVPEAKRGRLAVLYGLGPEAPLAPVAEAIGGDFFHGCLQSGGGGLVSTLADYARFASLLLRHGELDGVRLVGRKTVALMTANHVAPELFLPGTMPGFGFGLGVSVLLDPAQAGILGTPGSYGWGGWASTRFWVDPAEDLVALWMTQVIPTGPYPALEDFRTLVYQALVD